MHLLLMLLMLAAPQESSGGTIDATIRGTTEPLEVELLLRDESDAWHEVEHKRLAANERRVRFDGLEPGVYQILLRGPIATQQLGTKIAVGTNDVRRTTIAVERFTLTGQITFGDTQFANGGVLLKHRELGWRAGISLDANGKFAAPMWQRGTYLAEVRGPALPTAYIETIALDADTLRIAIPDGRITGIVRDAQSGAPISGATVALQTNVEQGETHARLVTGPDGRFDFGGIQSGRQTIRIFPTHGLEPEPIVFPLDDNARHRELDAKVDAGRSIAIVVIDKENDPIANAQVFAVADAKLRSRTTTDEDGRATVALPAGEAATLFIVPEEGPFGVHRVARESEKGRMQVYLPRTPSSLLIRAQTTNGATLPPFSLLMRFNGDLLPLAVAEELGVQLMTDANSEARLENIPTGSYEFWPYRTESEAASIIAAATALVAPIQVQVKTGENKIAVTFAAKVAARR